MSIVRAWKDFTVMFWAIALMPITIKKKNGIIRFIFDGCC